MLRPVSVIAVTWLALAACASWPGPGPAATAPPLSAGGGPAAPPGQSPATDRSARSAAARALAAPAAPPQRLVIPALRIQAVVEPIGVDASGRVAAPSQPDHVGWYSPGPAPGDAGDAVIDGHLDWTSGPAVFARLAQLKLGDEVAVVRADGSQIRFIVDSTATFPADARAEQLFVTTGEPSISLVTCSGAWDRVRGTYRNRLVVHASLAPSVVTDRPGDEGG